MCSLADCDPDQEAPGFWAESPAPLAGVCWVWGRVAQAQLLWLAVAVEPGRASGRLAHTERQGVGSGRRPLCRIKAHQPEDSFSSCETEETVRIHSLLACLLWSAVD